MSEEFQKRIDEIDERIKDLTEHRIMWAKAGGRGVSMAMQADGEIANLKKEKERLLKQIILKKEDEINGTNNLDIYLIQNKIEDLKEIKEQANFFRKHILKSQISAEERKLETAQGRSKK